MENKKTKAGIVRELIARAIENGFAYWPGEAGRAELSYIRGLVGQHNVFNGTSLSVMHERETKRIKVYVRDEKSKISKCPHCGQPMQN